MRPKYALPFLLFGGLVLGFLRSHPRPHGPGIFEHLTPVYDIKSLYASMKGPEYQNEDLLLSDGPAELLWLQGYEATMVGADGQTPKPQQFMCHNTLSIHRPLDQHRRLFGETPYGTRRLFTLSQGQYAIRFPEGYGIPILSTEKLMLQSQVLNLNEDAVGEQVRHKVKTYFVRDSEVKTPMHALCIFPSGVQVPIADPRAAKMQDPVQDGCAADAGGCPVGRDSFGRAFTGHWIVPPGHDERRSRQEALFPFDTAIHYIAAHVHPYAESLELRDVTTQKTVWKAEGASLNTSVGLDHITYFSSAEGLPVYAQHAYELISVYNNTSRVNQTAMAFMFFYVEDKQFHKPSPQTLERSDEGLCGPASSAAMLR